jgi:hypothetical protein
MSSISDYKIFVATPAIGILYEINGFLSSQVRLRAPLMFLLCSQNYQIHRSNIKRIGCIVMTIVPNNELRACNIYKKIW